MSVRDSFLWGAPDATKIELVRAGKLLGIGYAFGQSRVLGISTPGYQLPAYEGLHVYRLQSPYLRICYTLDSDGPGYAFITVSDAAGGGGPGSTVKAQQGCYANAAGTWGPTWVTVHLTDADALNEPCWIGFPPGSVDGGSAYFRDVIILEWPEKLAGIEDPWSGT